MSSEEKKKMRKVTFTLPEDLYIEYKKAILDLRTTPTADLRRHLQKVVDDAAGTEEES